MLMLSPLGSLLGLDEGHKSVAGSQHVIARKKNLQLIQNLQESLESAICHPKK